MFTLNEDLSIYATRGDIVFFTVSAEDNGKPYKFQAGDVVRIKVFGKKNTEDVVLQKDFPVIDITEKVEIFLTKEDMKIGDVISKPKDYWYEVVLNDDTVPQTIIGYDDDGAKVFKLFPEGDDVPEWAPAPEDVSVMDDELDMTSTKPVQNQAIAREFAAAKSAYEKADKNLASTISTVRGNLNKRVDEISENVSSLSEELAVERARIDNAVASPTTDGAEVTDIRVGEDGKTYASAGTAVRKQFADLKNSVANASAISDRAISPEKTDFAKCTYGNNLYDKNDMAIHGAWYYFSDDKVILQENEYTGNYHAIKIPFERHEGVTSLTIKIDVPNSTIYGWYATDEADTIIEKAISLSTNIYNDSYTFTIPENTVTLYISATWGSDWNENYHLMINAGEEAKPFEEYSKNILIDGLVVDPSYENRVKVHLPESYRLVVGDTFELFYKGVISCLDPSLYYIQITCNKGQGFKKRYAYTPNSGEVGAYTLKMEVYDLNHDLVASGSTNLIVAARAASPEKETVVLYVGDSLAINGYAPGEFKRRLTDTSGTPNGDGMSNIKFIGTCEANGAKFEGYGGWNFKSYNTANSSDSFVWITAKHDKTDDDQHSIYEDANGVQWKLETIEADKIKLVRVSSSGTIPASGTLAWVSGGTNKGNIVYTGYVVAAGNPFWNESTGCVDFANYASKQGVSGIDHIYVLLGWNSAYDAEAVQKENARTFIENVKAAYPDCKVTLLGLQIPALDGLANNYGSTGSAYAVYYNLMSYVFKLEQWYKEVAAEFDGVYVVNLSGQFDTENNMQTSTRPVNARNSTLEEYQSNGVHPAKPGYYQIADVCYRDFVHKLQ